MKSCKTHQITALSLLTLIAAAYIIMVLRFPVAYLIGTYEDLVGEWCQVFFFASAAMYGFRLVLARSPYRLFFGLLAVACVLVVLEEISWGQRLFDIATPEIMRHYNLQKEVNVHNLIIGPVETTLKVVIYRLVALGLVLYGFAFPLALAVNWKPAGRLEKLGIPAPPLYLWPFFVISAILQLELFYFNEAEVAEIILPFGLAIFGLHYLVAHQSELPPRKTGTWPDRVSKHLAFRIVLIFAWVLSLSVATTYGVYASPRLKKVTHERLMKGVNSFAKRYKKYGLWGPSLTLYHKALEERPTSTSIMRNLALCYDRIGRGDKRDFYLDRAEEIGMMRYRKNPDSIKANLSLALTYRQKEDTEKSDFHFNRALVNARKNAEQKPRSASAAYRLGQTYVLMKEYRNALPHLERALQLQPDSTKYGKAVRKVRARVNGER
jgi:hypothetical protein